MPDPTFTSPDLTAFARLDELGLTATGQRLEPGRAVIACKVVDEDRWCRQCGGLGHAYDPVVRPLAHEPFGSRPTELRIQVRRYRCGECSRLWRQDTIRAAEPRTKISRRGLAWALESLVVGHASMTRIAHGLGVAWNTANDAVLAEGKRRLIDEAGRFDDVAVVGVDEHVWRHAGRGDKYVTVIIDLTPVRDGTGPSRLLDMVPGRSKAVFTAWLAGRPDGWRQRVQVVAMDGFTGYKTAASEDLPDAVTVMDPFHVVRLAGQALDETRRRVQQFLHGHRGRKTDPLYRARRTLATGHALLSEPQRTRLQALFANEQHVEVEATWGVYQNMIAAYRHPNPTAGRAAMARLIDSISTGVPAGLVELRKLGRTLKKRAPDVLAYFDHPRTSNGPTEAINGRLEHLRGTALGFRNLRHYITRSLLEAGGFRPQLHSQL